MSLENSNAEDLSKVESTNAEVVTEPVVETPSLSDQLSDEAFNTDESSEPVVETKVEPKQEEAKEAEPEKSTITDDDLKPLESKNVATNERFTKITEGYKEVKTQLEAVTAENNQYKESFNVLQTLGYNDERAAQDLVEFSSYRKAIASGDVEGISNIIASEIKNIELALGKKLNISVNALDDYPELKQKVDALELDEGTAIELARVRAIDARVTREKSQQQQRQLSDQQSQQYYDSAINEVAVLQDNLSKTDPDYRAVVAAMQNDLAEIRELVEPHKWAKAVQLKYNATKQKLVEAQKQTKQFSPMRGNSNAGNKPADLPLSEALSDENWEV